MQTSPEKDVCARIFPAAFRAFYVFYAYIFKSICIISGLELGNGNGKPPHTHTNPHRECKGKNVTEKLAIIFIEYAICP